MLPKKVRGIKIKTDRITKCIDHSYPSGTLRPIHKRWHSLENDKKNNSHIKYFNNCFLFIQRAEESKT